MVSVERGSALSFHGSFPNACPRLCNMCALCGRYVRADNMFLLRLLHSMRAVVRLQRAFRHYLSVKELMEREELLEVRSVAMAPTCPSKSRATRGPAKPTLSLWAAEQIEWLPW